MRLTFLIAFYEQYNTFSKKIGMVNFIMPEKFVIFILRSRLMLKLHIYLFIFIFRVVTLFRV